MARAGEDLCNAAPCVCARSLRRAGEANRLLHTLNRWQMPRCDANSWFRDIYVEEERASDEMGARARISLRALLTLEITLDANFARAPMSMGASSKMVMVILVVVDFFASAILVHSNTHITASSR